MVAVLEHLAERGDPHTPISYGKARAANTDGS